MRTLIALACVALALPAAAAATCRAEATPTTVVELYTSEGCNSCPPADRWLSTLKGRADVLALAFHVDYWDRLGWKDRFANSAYTQRQQQLQRATGARFIYTPQIVVDGRDWRGWPSLPAPAARLADIELTRDGTQVQARIGAHASAPSRLAAYWVVIEDGHVSDVRSGENAGVTLRHDAVVMAYREVPAWDTRGREPKQVRFDAPAPGGGRAGAVALVVVDAATLRPVGAARLPC